MEKPVSTTTLQALVRARLHLVQYGWQQRCLGCYEGPTCLVGAVAYASEPNPQTGQDLSLMRLRQVIQDDIVSYNNTPGRTLEEILAVLDKAIDLEVASLVKDGTDHAYLDD